jgi:DNA repair protein RadC
MVVREGRRSTAVLDTPAKVFRFMSRVLLRRDRETFVRLDLDARNRVLGWEIVSVGTLTQSLVHPREVFKAAILSNAVGIIVMHNHPSGDPAPSPEDMRTTERLVEAGKLLGVPLIDHLIVTDDGGFFSFKEKGLL